MAPKAGTEWSSAWGQLFLMVVRPLENRNLCQHDGLQSDCGRVQSVIPVWAHREVTHGGLCRFLSVTAAVLFSESSLSWDFHLHKWLYFIFLLFFFLSRVVVWCCHLFVMFTQVCYGTTNFGSCGWLMLVGGSSYIVGAGTEYGDSFHFSSSWTPFGSWCSYSPPSGSLLFFIWSWFFRLVILFLFMLQCF